MDDAAVRIDEEHGGAQTVERVGEGRGFRGLVLDRPADQGGAANVGGDEPHAPARLRVHQALPHIPEHREQGGAGGGLVERDADCVDPALGTCPLLVETCGEELVEVQDVAGAERLADLAKTDGSRGRIDLDVVSK